MSICVESLIHSLECLTAEQKVVVLQNLLLQTRSEVSGVQKISVDAHVSDQRKQATALNKEREQHVFDILSGTCEDVGGLRAQMLSHIPGVVSLKKEGGLGKHYDYTLILSDGSSKTLELKTSQGNWKAEDLIWKPWGPAVQFLQGQVKSKLAESFVGPCGLDMLQTFFHSIVCGFVEKEEALVEARGLTWEGYRQGATGMDVEDVKTDEKARAFFRILRSDSALAERLRLTWIAFEESYLGEHHLDHEAFTKIVKEVIEAKDWWLCRVKNGDSWIEGFHVLDVQYKGVERKRNGGCVFQYTMTLCKKSGGTPMVVPITWKLYWKNGGQAVQNLNFLVL